jgi:hypothetical protein
MHKSIPGVHTSDWHQISEEIGEIRPNDELLTQPTKDWDTAKTRA